ncbi:COX assembly mitochondrial protein [Aphelenchoides besseyi]|nr:COX assembly mitochondrial protein [Aphelenchoides besseyi]
MQPDLSPHLHTVECNYLVELMKKCREENPWGRYFGKCNYWDEAVWQCTKKERIWRRSNNPRYKKRTFELKHLPEEYFTPALWKLREEGSLPKPNESSGCQI